VNRTVGAAKHDGGESRGGALLRKEARVQDAAVGVIQRDTQLSRLAIALVITSRRVIARTSRSISCIERLYPSRRSCLNVYAPDISDVYDNPSNPVCREQLKMTAS
jgi:hypothetical protein